jgi:hypothetical protein
VFVDLLRVTDFDACALLYLTAAVERLKAQGTQIGGSYPMAVAALRMLYEAGWESFLRLPQMIRKNFGDDEPGLRIVSSRCSEKLNPRAWVALHEFFDAEPISDVDKDTLYSVFQECVENAWQHAYGAQRSGKWYALAIRPSPGRPLRAVVLDTGRGIPGSIRQRLADRALKVGDAFLSFIRTVTGTDPATIGPKAWNADWNCIVHASMGERTETEEPQRGTGLSGIRHAIKATDAGSMHILSARTAVTWRRASDPSPVILPHVRGTVVCIELDRPANVERDVIT